MNTFILPIHYKKTGRFPFSLLFFVCLVQIGISCKKLIEIPAPLDSISSANVFTNDETAIATVIGLYTNMSKVTNSSTGGFAGLNGLSVSAGLSSDELVLHNGLVNTSKYQAYNNNALDAVAAGGFGAEHWNPLYSYLYECNSAIEGLSAPAAEVLTPAIRKQLLGEVKFLRAFFYFQLVNLYGAVPLALTRDYQVNALLAKSPPQQVYQQIKNDLTEAQSLLSEHYPSSKILTESGERVRPTKWAAAALLARVHLYIKEYQQAESAASLVIDHAALFELPPLNNVFLKNSKEAIWQLQPTTTYFNTEEGRLFVILPAGPSNTQPVYLSELLLNTFEPGDERAVPGNWIDSTIYKVSATVNDTVYYPYKYKKSTLDSAISGSTALSKMTEYQMALRLGEQYLIRAEARAQLNKLEEAKADLNAIRLRAGLEETTATDQTSLLTAIQHERQVELFTEWGHRWFDLKRTEMVDAVMTIATPYKSQGLTTWQSYQQLYPIPLQDINRAPNLVQNPGY
ncbi:RagB/SusD family nutrient uptake outer membrane protein [Pseudoflavitalea sp. X16]|uniref:RagB/SusD family nutrient uptake outer membrane protein n=1 Tax=Paraflavitalea devenefica TaxID=2716334 RepID=UPI00141EAEF9|nr:RagB/SusD family nutrient uptake outer membrane protein [Paraflavitalea devenefica]NII27768.1 RagB/SusD family nutrient uptake outer membrane protein [Paraflavitalea devenefica]